MKLVCLILFIAGLCYGVSQASECIARGRFPNNDVADCRGYTICLLGGAAGFMEYKLTCPATFVYSHLELQCTNSTTYQCLPTYACNGTGNFENRSSKNCSSYIACPEGLGEMATAREVQCSNGQVFNPLTSTCVNSSSYECPTVTTTEIPVVITTKIPSKTESPPSATMPQNTTNDHVFHVAGSASVNCAVDICSKHTVLFAMLMIVNFRN